MSAPAPSSPSVVRSASSANRAPPTYGSSSDRPHRTQSTSVRRDSPNTSGHRRSYSQTQGHGQPRSPSQQADLANVARRDFEQQNLAKPPSSSHRSSSRDRGQDAPPPYRTESVRTAHRSSSSRQDSSRYQYNAPTQGSSHSRPANGAGPESLNRPQPPTQGKRRTTIDTQTGHWSLGKTIGAGSMGKVKLAKNVDTGEQVRNSHSTL